MASFKNLDNSEFLLHRQGNGLGSENTCFMVIKFIVFQVEAFQFSKYHENEVNHDKRNFKEG